MWLPRTIHWVQSFLMGFVAMLHVIKPGELRTERLLIVSSRCKVSDCHVTLSAYGESAAKARVQEWIIAGPGLKPGTRHSRSQTWLCPKRTTQSISPAEADSRRGQCRWKLKTLMFCVIATSVILFMTECTRTLMTRRCDIKFLVCHFSGRRLSRVLLFSSVVLIVDVLE